MKIIKINKEELNSFIFSQAHSQFLQSWEWGEFQAAVGLPVFRMGVEDKDDFVAAATFITKQLPLGFKYWYCPRGPIYNFQFLISNFQTISNDLISKYEKIINFLFSEINKQAKKKNIIFLRFEPQFKIQNSKFKIQNTIHVQPEKTQIINLTKSQEGLLAAMHQKTRYNIRLSKKLGVETSIANQEEFEPFWRLMEETRVRDKFRLHPKKYYKKMLQVPGIKLLLARIQEQVIAGIITSSFGDTVTYLHGASSSKFRNVMASYLLQWQAIRLAKDQGYRRYDLNGIDKVKWPGVTRFKKGFGGMEINFPGTFDLVFNKTKYQVYELLRRIRRII